MFPLNWVPLIKEWQKNLIDRQARWVPKPQQ